MRNPSDTSTLYNSYYKITVCISVRELSRSEKERQRQGRKKEKEREREKERNLRRSDTWRGQVFTRGDLITLERKQAAKELHSTGCRWITVGIQLLTRSRALASLLR